MTSIAQNRENDQREISATLEKCRLNQRFLRPFPVRCSRYYGLS
mgnify:CR=1 FL=1